MAARKSGGKARPSRAAKKKTARKPKARVKGTVEKRMAAKTDKDWQAESDLRSLREAAAVRADPQRSKAARALAAAERKALANI